MPVPPLVEILHPKLVESCDVLVCGAGPAGFAAALSAARQGARVTLIEQHGCLGGVWTAGALSWIIDHENKGGIMREIKDALKKRGAMARNAQGTFTSAYDVEAMKHLLEEMALAARVRLRMHTRVVAAIVDDRRRLTHIVTESKSGREAWRAEVFVDATGDGDLAAQAGCGFALGMPGSGATQPMSLMALLTGIHAGEISAFFNDDNASPSLKEKAKLTLLQHLERQGCFPSYSAPTLFRIHDNLFALMATHQYGFSALSAEDLTRATLQARGEIAEIVEALRRSGPPWAQLRLVATASQIGVREGRRIHGRYTVTEKDLREGRQHQDAICTVTFVVDIHSPDPAKGKGYGNAGILVKPYQIPLRAAIAADVDGLMMAGRCISGDFISHASYRVTGNAVQMGEAVGKVAAFAALNHIPPHKAPTDRVLWEKVRPELGTPILAATPATK
jgi:hypothetical protein